MIEWMPEKTEPLEKDISVEKVADGLLDDLMIFESIFLKLKNRLEGMKATQSNSVTGKRTEANINEQNKITWEIKETENEIKKIKYKLDKISRGEKMEAGVEIKSGKHKLFKKLEGQGGGLLGELKTLRKKLRILNSQVFEEKSEWELRSDIKKRNYLEEEIVGLQKKLEWVDRELEKILELKG